MAFREVPEGKRLTSLSPMEIERLDGFFVALRVNRKCGNSLAVYSDRSKREASRQEVRLRGWEWMSRTPINVNVPRDFPVRRGG